MYIFMTYRTTIGLEIHAELNTNTKMFCNSKNDSDETEPNVNVCPVCLAHPGTLPAINQEAVRHIARVGASVGGTLADYTEFDRKSYFYPDIPKGYQISQYELPFISGGSLAGVDITRIHLEEDTARSSHSDVGSLVDFNRAGVPLMELVTEPVIHDAETAGKFARELQLLLRTLGASYANLEKGEMRVEANISVSKTDTFGTKVEVKNINSFRAVERAIEFEVARQIELLEKGETVSQETRGWDEDRQVTFSQRVKEGSADYRYFPEPDLPKLLLSEIPWLASDVIKASLPELPWEKRARYESLGLKAEQAAQLTTTLEDSTFFDAVLAELNDAPDQVLLAANYLLSDIAGAYGSLTPKTFAELMGMIAGNQISSRGAKDALLILREQGGESAVQVVEAAGLLQVSDTGALQKAVEEVIAANPDVVAEYRAGKESVLQYLVGQCMKATKGAGNPGALRDLLVAALKV